jgi:uncharacterized BrkB/YihY/UPF0761 family membrane protein
MEIIPLFFGVMGSLIPIAFFATIWYWMKYNEIENSEMKNVAKWRVTGYSLLVMATWFTCGIFSIPRALRPDKANIALAIPIAYVAMILFVFGFSFLLISEGNALLVKKRS